MAGARAWSEPHRRRGASAAFAMAGIGPGRDGRGAGAGHRVGRRDHAHGRVRPLRGRRAGGDDRSSARRRSAGGCRSTPTAAASPTASRSARRASARSTSRCSSCGARPARGRCPTSPRTASPTSTARPGSAPARSCRPENWALTSGKETGMKHLLKSRRILAAVSALVIADGSGGNGRLGAGQLRKEAASRDAHGPAEGCNEGAVGEDRRSAKREGSVTLYTSQNPVLLAQPARRSNRSTASRSRSTARSTPSSRRRSHAEDGVAQAQGRRPGDRQHVDRLGMQKPAEQVGRQHGRPAFYAKGYDRKKFGGPQKANVVGPRILGIAGTRGCTRRRTRDYTDVLDPNLNGQDRRRHPECTVARRLVPVARGELREEHHRRSSPR